MVRSYLSLVRTLPTRTYQPCKWEGMGMRQFSHSNLSNLGVNTGKIWGMRVNIDYSEGGTCNS